MRALRLGGGTAAPGLMAATIDPHILRKTAASLSAGSLIVTGTNGKTTTSRLIADILRCHGLQPIHNRAGSNMMRGLVSTALAAASLDGKLAADVGVWEVDEATLPEAVGELAPQVVLVNNLFRDQLDRYGEVNTVAAVWERALEMLPASAVVVLNADDPRVAHLGSKTERRVLYFGVEDVSCALADIPEAADSTHCVNCAAPLAYETVYSSHMGRYHCPNCGLRRPTPDVQATNIRSTITGSDVRMQTPQGEIAVHVPLPGLYNVYNVLAATAVALTVGVTPQEISAAVAGFRSAFGRVERLRAGDKEIVLFLVKNPAGFNEVIRTVFGGAEQRRALIIINDLLADGTDVSWLWDVDFEALCGKVAWAMVSGIRAADMALRLKYAGVEPALGAVAVENSIQAALAQALTATPAGQTLYVLPTYTAMLDTKDVLAQLGLGGRWQDD